MICVTLLLEVDNSCQNLICLYQTKGVQSEETEDEHTRLSSNLPHRKLLCELWGSHSDVVGYSRLLGWYNLSYGQQFPRCKQSKCFYLEGQRVNSWTLRPWYVLWTRKIFPKPWKALWPFEMSVLFYQSTQRNISEEFKPKCVLYFSKRTNNCNKKSFQTRIEKLQVQKYTHI